MAWLVYYGGDLCYSDESDWDDLYVSCLLDLVYPSGGLASIGLWQRKVRRW